MLSDQLGPKIKNLVGYSDPTRADYGFGLGLAVRATPGVVRMMGSAGQFSWPRRQRHRPVGRSEGGAGRSLSVGRSRARSACTTARRSTRWSTTARHRVR
jgi:hypothetical protein